MSPPAWFQAMAVERSASGWRYLVAITDGPLDGERKARLEAAGARLLDYVPANGYRLRLSPEDEPAVRALPFLVWLGEIPAHLKVDPSLAERAAEGSGGVRVRVILAPEESVSRVMDALAGLDAVAAPAGAGDAWRVAATIPADRLARAISRLASLPEVEAIEPALPLRLLNQDAVWVHQSFVGPSPQQTPIFDRGIFGCGQIVGLSDSGQDYDSCFFRDTVNGAPPIVSCAQAPCPPAAPAGNRRKNIIYYNWSGTASGDDDTCPTAVLGASGHGTHTSGAIAGDNLPYANCATFGSPGRNGGDGQAPGAKLVVQELGDGLEYLNARGGTLWNIADVAYRTGARIHSNSWGAVCYNQLGACIAGCTIPYESFARDADLAMWTHRDLLIVTAAGNAGTYCPPPVAVGTPGIAKNPLTVGAVGHGASASIPSSFSSPGPIFDGRLKPTVVAQGEANVSAASDAVIGTNNCATCSLDGTSLSAPTVAGLAALVREYYTAGYYATGGRAPAQGITPSGALMKATIIDGAAALGASAPAPDFKSGWGRVLLGSTLAFSGSPFALRAIDHRDGIGTGSVVTRAYDVSAGTPFRATLVWSDYPAALGAATARVNELKLEVTDPAGTVWFQSLDPASGLPLQTSDPARPHDDRNVEERLVFNTPASGRWIVRVRGVSVPWGPQPFALVVRGSLADCAAPPAPGAPSLTTPAPRQVLVSWTAVAGAASYNVYRSLGGCPAGPWIPVATGVTATSFLDATVSGGVPYSYSVAAASDAAAACESAPSSCASVVPTGECVLPPDFRGIASASSPGQSACSAVLSWEAASAPCGGSVVYNIYRSTAPDFTRDAASRIARCVMGSSYTDSAGLVSGTSYYYAVRAEDATSGHGGPCRGGNEDGNLARAAATPAGTLQIGTWRDDAGDTGAALFEQAPPWSIAATGGSAGPNVYTIPSSAGLCADLTSPILALADPAQGPQLTFVTRHNLAYDPFGIFGAEGSLGQVEIATGPAFSSWTRLPLTPDYPALIEFPLNDCPTTASIRRYFSGTAMTYRTYSASLVNWGGGDVRIRFHLSGDYIYDYGNWWIDDVVVTQTYVHGACATVPVGPPPIPDGATVPGFAMRAARSGADVAVIWDAARCPAAAVNLYRGVLGDYTSFTSGACNLPATGSAVVPMPANSWFILAATDGLTTDGSWGRDPLTGAERVYAGASAACPAITNHVTNNGCP